MGQGNARAHLPFDPCCRAELDGQPPTCSVEPNILTNQSSYSAAALKL